MFLFWELSAVASNELPQIVRPVDDVCNGTGHFLWRIQYRIPKPLVPSLADGMVQINFQGDGNGTP